MSTTITPPPCELCGWLAAAVSALGFGSFGVPIKGAPVALDPLVFQSYKTSMCFLTSWFVLVFGEDFVFSPWGIVSGLFWVPGGMATVYAIQAAGLAVGIGIGSSFIVLVSFVWGIFVFQERVHSKVWASVAILSMMAGLLGMSYFSSPESEEEHHPVIHRIVVDDDHLELEHTQQEMNLSTATTTIQPQSARRRADPIEYKGVATQSEEETNHTAEETACTQHETDSIHCNTNESQEPDGILHEPETIYIFHRKVSKRRMGMLSAMFTGIWGGSILAPMKYAPSDAKGTHFLISFAIGASIVNISIWLLRYLYHWNETKSVTEAYAKLPSFHLTDMWKPGAACGLLWSFGNFFSLISVFYLGEGVGYPLVQTSILISGLWGVLWFKEVTGARRIFKWFMSSLLTVFGILLLSYEHHEH